MSSNVSPLNMFNFCKINLAVINFSTSEMSFYYYMASIYSFEEFTLSLLLF